MSYIRTIFTNLEAMDISFTKENGSTSGIIPCWDLDEVKEVQRAEMPVRILLPSEEWEGGSEPMEPISMGSSSVSGVMIWRVTDLMLWAGAGAGRGIRDYLPDLVRYAGEYVETIMDNVNITSYCKLNSIEPRIGVFEWPQASESIYYGVSVLTQWKEIINP